MATVFGIQEKLGSHDTANESTTKLTFIIFVPIIISMGGGDDSNPRYGKAIPREALYI